MCELLRCLVEGVAAHPLDFALRLLVGVDALELARHLLRPALALAVAPSIWMKLVIVCWMSALLAASACPTPPVADWSEWPPQA